MTDVTENWCDFGYREKYLAIALLTAWREGKIASHIESLGDNVRAAFNPNSGYVFLTNDEYDAFLFNGDVLDIFLHCFNCGHEDFPQDMYDNPSCDECKGYANNWLEHEEEDEDD